MSVLSFIQQTQQSRRERALGLCISNSRLTTRAFVSYTGRGFRSEKNQTEKTIEKVIKKEFECDLKGAKGVVENECMILFKDKTGYLFAII